MFGRPPKHFAAFMYVIAAVSASGAFGQAAPKSETTSFQIVGEGLCCEGCTKKVAAQLYTAPGVINVQADVATHTVTITAKPSPKLTLEKLWQAVEKAKGKPTQLTTSQAVYTFLGPDQLPAEEQVRDAVYTIEIAGMHDMPRAEQVAKSLHSFRGIESMSVDLAKGALLVTPASESQLSPWALAAAIGQGEQVAASITGPHGCLTIDPIEQQAARPAASYRQ